MSGTSIEANISTLISLENIQQQIEHCENIVKNIDKLVPNLYKIRQQALAQKNYILDIQYTLTNNNNQLNSTLNKVYTKTELSTSTASNPGFLTTDYPTVLAVTVPSVDVNDSYAVMKYKNKEGLNITKNNIATIEDLRAINQSLYKFKHDQGTAVHFTTQQIDQSTNGENRLKGLNLSDVESITEGLNDYLSISDTEYAILDSNSAATPEYNKIKNTVRKLFAPVSDITGSTNLSSTSIDTSAINNINESDGTTTNYLDIFKAPISASIDITEELTSERNVKARRKDFASEGPVSSEYLRIVTFGLD